MARRIGTVAGEPSLSASAVTGRQSICAIEDLPRMGLYRVPWHRMKKLLARRHHTPAGFCCALFLHHPRQDRVRCSLIDPDPLLWKCG
jgi:hypothetical protein